MPACAACGGSNREGWKGARDSGSWGVRGVAAEGDQDEANHTGRSLGRALRRQRSRWVSLTGIQRFRRVVLFGFTPIVLMALPLIMGASTDEQLSLCPAEGAATVESVPAMLDDSGALKSLI
ncbi:MAG: hypothetical protein QOK03_2533 [Candidatus Binataceae bacterium]|nr:hypothetical protein [Candidatus Binataceae bacterium]